ncbi:UPF0481 protein At3g47200-like isoform X1 [Diospyros lotus]|uniref:UPF0481 protein At3g47200-like isoform X1 n=1 Tax=Diospyros lotus TaxID=55363 RepID=UPI002250D2DF|nr:UPF0481 protein At3g47200-like isoform X1 [Diospyros lotus]
MGSWVVEMQPTRSIYKVPPFISKINEIAYKPQLVSFGPYHYGDPQLAWMEAHKRRAYLRFIDRSGRNAEEVYNIIAEMAQHLKDSYDSLDSKWKYNTNGFVQLMILDGCFMLELIHVYKYKNYYSNDDPVFSRHGKFYVMQFIKADILMLENQLPMSLLLKLKDILNDSEHDIEALNKDILWLLSYNISNHPKMGECLHVLHLYRKSLLHIDNEHENAAPRFADRGEEKNDEVSHNFYCIATKLYLAGVRFEKSRSNSLRDITFDDGILKIPNFIVDRYSKSMFLNLMAFECCYILAGNDITSFVAFMDHIIDDEHDIKLLTSGEIITNFIGTDKKAANLFNTMSKDLVMEMNNNLCQVYNNLISYCNKPWPKHRANVVLTYFREPLSIISICLFYLSVVQTIFTIIKG